MEKSRKGSKSIERDPAIWQGLLFCGDNISGMLHLLQNYHSKGLKVDIIEIDPPYNVGGIQGYKNVWNGQSKKYGAMGETHGEFLHFMETRLRLAKDLLAEDGTIFIHICEKEFSHLKLLMNMIFGEENAIATFIWNKGQGAAKTHVVDSHEYVLCYAKNKERMPKLSKEKANARLMINKAKDLYTQFPFVKSQELFKKWVNEKCKDGTLSSGEGQYSFIDRNSGRVFQSDNSCAHDDPHGKRCRLALKHPVTGKKCPIPKNGWKWKEETLLKLVSECKIHFGKDHTTVPRLVRYLDEHLSETPQTVINMSSNGKNDLSEEFAFLTPKPVNLIKYLISLFPKKNAVVLDFFAGSGTTAFAVDKLNAEDGGDRKWILIEEMESTINRVIIPRLRKAEILKFEVIKVKKQLDLAA